MARTITLHMKSGKQYSLPLDPEQTKDKSPDDCAHSFFQEWDSTITTLRLNNYVFYTKEIEAFEFT